MAKTKPKPKREFKPVLHLKLDQAVYDEIGVIATREDRSLVAVARRLLGYAIAEATRQAARRRAKVD